MSRRGWLAMGLGLAVGLLWRVADSQPPVPRFRLQGAHTSVADVDHAGALYVTAPGGLAVSQSGEWNIRHISSVLHISGAMGSLLNVAASQSGPWTIQGAHQAGVWNLAHVSTVLHVAIVQGTSGGAGHLLVAPVYQAGTWTVQPGNTANTTAWLVRNVAGQSGSQTIQAAHQGGEWNVRHVTSVLHVSIIQGGAGGAAHLLVAPVYQAGAWGVSAAQSGIFTVQAAHQAGQWNLAHLTSIVHVRGTMQLAASYGQIAFLTHFGALAVTCYTNAGVAESCAGSGGSGDVVNVFHQSTIRHISSVTHVAGVVQMVASYGQIAFLTHAGALAVTCYTNAGVAETCGGAGSSDAVNVFHQSTVRHVSSVTHVAIVQGSAGGASHLLVAPVYQAGTWTVQPGNTPNTTAWLANLQHVSSVVHVAVISRGVGIGKTITYVSVAQGGAGTTALAAADVNNKHKILGAILTMSAAGTLKFTDGVADLTGAMDVAATGGFVLPTSTIPYQQTGAVNRALNLVTATGAAKGVVIIVTEP